MKKFFAWVFAFIALALSTNILFAEEGAYKNNLLKIELTKIDENNYDVGLYTQKIYNEPVKIIKKSDNVYYFLLPETSNSITSTPPLDAIKSVMIKSYPYAGQDMDNSYTKVAIITSKPLNLTTSLRTLDTSVSPRLDPLRLAKLDEVFERYSERLAQNNVPTPLAEFRKTAASQRPALQSNVDVKNKDVIAQHNVQKPVVTKPVEKTETQPAKKIAQAQKPVLPVIAASQPVKKQTALPIVQKQAQPAPAIKQAQTSSSKPKEQQTKVVKVEPAPVKTVMVKPAETQAPKTVTAKTENKAPSVQELEKQLASTTPTNVEFGKKVEIEEAESSKEIKAEVIEPYEPTEQKAQEVEKPQMAVPKKQNSVPLLAGLFVLFFVLYTGLKAAKNKNKQIAQNTNVNATADLKELLRKRAGGYKAETEEQLEEEPVQTEEAPAPSYHEEFHAIDENYASNPVVQENNILIANDVTLNDAEKVKAFNAYMDTMPDESDFNEVANITGFTEDDQVIRELYTPITSYSSSGDATVISSVQESFEEPVEPQVDEAFRDDDVATIVSSSKLTETRGLYLAKFEGTTSLVGYIQDDIYVLYNFEDNIQETSIESSLAQENDTDSLYIVNAGGKKLMVKSTPYDLSLEMIMQ